VDYNGLVSKPRRAKRLTGSLIAFLVVALCWTLGGVPLASASSSSIPNLYGSLPPVGGTAKAGGTITFGQINGQQPNWIFPITLAADSSVYNAYEFQNYFFEPLYWGTEGTVPTINSTVGMGEKPVYSNGGKTVTFSLKQGYKWSNGAAVDANDVLFFIDLLKAAVKESAANFGNYTPGFFPDNVVSAKATGKYTVQLDLTKAYNESFFSDNELSLIIPLPSTSWDVDKAGGAALDYTNPANAKLIYNYLAAGAKSLSTYGTNKLWQDVDGPFKLTSYTAATGAFTAVPNPSFGGPNKPKFAELKTETFTTTQAEFNQLIANNLSVGLVDASSLAEVSRIKSNYSVFGLPDFGFQAGFYNFTDKTGDWGKVISQAYIRQVFAEVEDQPAYVKGLYKGAAVPDYGPVGVAPASPYAPANAKTAPYPYSISGAAKVLSSHGWKVVPNGSTSCVKPGTGAGECGAGIPAGTKIAPSFFYSNSPPVFAEQAQALAAAAKQVGIELQLTSKTFAFLVQNYSAAAAKSNDNKWAINDFGGFSVADYPTTHNIFNTGGSFNFGGYSDPKADSLINDAVYSNKPGAVSTEASYLTEQQPALFTPASDFIYAVSNKLSATTVDAFSGLTQFHPVPQDWFFKQ
jgi:peptide/nickel transport system substrate-binding protein